jgi:AcrR family transcriptional regulator
MWAMADTRSKIIKAATKAMNRNGYHGTSMEKIAKRAGIAKSTIFHHFKNKEDILHAILEQTIPRAIFNLTLIVHDRNLAPREKLKAFLKFHLNLVEEYGDVLDLYFEGSRFLSRQNRRIYIERRRIYTELVREIIREMQQERPDGNLSGLNPTIVAHTVLGMCNWTYTWYKKDGKLDMSAIADQFHQLLVGSPGTEEIHAER